MRRMKKSKVLVGFLSLLIVTVVVWEGRAQSQEAYPTRPIEMIVPYAAGGSSDLHGRTVASFLSKKLGVPVNVINKPGGNAIPGVLSVYNANPDGYTLLVDGNTTNSMMGVAVKDLPFKVMDRTFVSITGFSPQLFVVAAKSPLQNMKDLAAEVKRDPENFKWTMHGAGTDSVGFAVRQFFKEIDVDIRKTKAITVAGGAPGVIMVAGGNAVLECTTVASATPSLRAGTIKGLSVTSKDRDPNLPDVPTTAESGYPNVNIMQSYVISGPPKLPAFIIAKLNKAMEEIFRDPEAIAKFRSIGIEISYHNSEAARKFIIKESDDLSKLWSSVQ